MTLKPDAKDIYEVAYLADRLGGPESKAVIATTYNVSREKNKNSGIYQRFKKMKDGFFYLIRNYSITMFISGSSATASLFLNRS